MSYLTYQTRLEEKECVTGCSNSLCLTKKVEKLLCCSFQR